MAAAIAVTVGLASSYLLLRVYLKFTRGVCTSTTNLTGKTVIVTGGNRGIGYQTSLDMATRNAKVIVACRGMESGKEAVEKIKQETGNEQVFLQQLDLSSMESVRKFAKEINEKEPRLDILINNAGIGAVPERKLVEGLEVMYATNHFGPFLLTNLLIEKLKKNAPSRIVVVSSDAHRFGRIQFDNLGGEKRFIPGLTYCNTKLANIMFARELSKKLQGSGITVHVLHPGTVNSDFFTTFPWYLKPIFILAAPFLFKSSEQGAQTSIYCAVSEELQSKSGLYYEDCRTKEPKQHAKDDAVAKKLWEVSETLTGLSGKL